MRAIRSFVAVAFLAAAISSAQASTPIPPLPEVPIACALLSSLDVQEAVGIPVGEGVSRLRTGTLTSCSFAAERGGQVAILVRRAPSAEWVSEQIGRMNRGVQFGTWRELRGIGSRSFLYDMHRSGAVLCIFGAGYYLQISVLRVGDTFRVPAVLEKVAAKAVVRLSGRIGR
jgi:hypothetical protein